MRLVFCILVCSCFSPTSEPVDAVPSTGRVPLDAGVEPGHDAGLDADAGADAGHLDAGSCVVGGAGCGANETCIDELGSPTCACRPGFISTGGACSADPALYAWYPLDGTADDLSGNARDGVVEGAVPTTDRFGRPARALAIPGDGTRVRLPQFAAFGTALTVSAWARIDAFSMVSDPEGGRIASNETGGVFNGIFALTQLPTNNGSPNRVELLTWGATLSRIYSATPLTIATWVHVAATVNGTSVSLYIDGGLASSATHTNYSVPARTWYLGNVHTTATLPLRGAIDDVRFYTRALTPLELNVLRSEMP